METILTHTVDDFECTMVVRDTGGTDGVLLPMLSWDLWHYTGFYLQPLKIRSDGQGSVVFSDKGSLVWDATLPPFDYHLPEKFVEEIYPLIEGEDVRLSVQNGSVILMTSSTTITMKLGWTPCIDMSNAKTELVCVFNKDKLPGLKRIRHNRWVIEVKGGRICVDNKSIPALVAQEMDAFEVILSGRKERFMEYLPSNEIYVTRNSDFVFIGDGCVKLPFHNL